MPKRDEQILVLFFLMKIHIFSHFVSALFMEKFILFFFLTDLQLRSVINQASISLILGALSYLCICNPQHLQLQLDKLNTSHIA